MYNDNLSFLEERLPSDFWSKLNFSDWKGIFQRAQEDYDFLKTALQGMLKTAKTFTEWFKIRQLQMPKKISHLPTDFRQIKSYVDFCHLIETEPTDAMRLEGDLKTAQFTALNMMRQLADSYLQWYEIIDDITADEKIKNEAADKIADLIEQAGDKPFEHWQHLFSHSPSGHRLEKIALSKMLACAKTFDHFSQIYYLRQTDQESKKTALDKMSKTAKTYEHWKKIYEIKDTEIEIKKQALENMFRLSKSAEECLEVSDQAKEIDDKMLSTAAFMKMVEYGDCAVYGATLRTLDPCNQGSFNECLGSMIDSAETFSDCEKAIVFCLPRKQFFDRLRQKMFSHAKTFYEWNALLLCSGKSIDFQEKALLKMLELASNPDEYLKVYEESFYSGAENLDKMRQKILDNISKLNTGFEQWLKIYDHSVGFIRENDHGKLSDIALVKMVDQAAGFEELETILKKLYQENIDNSTKIERELYIKILPKAGQLAKTVDQYISVFLLAPVESEIKTAMIEKMQEWVKN